jgi:hypothetical protein
MKAIKTAFFGFLLLTVGIAHAGRFDNHRQFEISVPQGTRIMDATSTFASAVMPGGCTDNACYFQVIYQNSGDMIHSVTLGKDQDNKCTLTLNELPYWFSSDPIFSSPPQCVGTYDIDLYYGIKKLGLFRYGIKMFLKKGSFF